MQCKASRRRLRSRYRLRWLLYFLEHSNYEDVTLLGQWGQDEFTEQEADLVCKALRGYRMRTPQSSLLKRACEEIENKWLNRYPKSALLCRREPCGSPSFIPFQI